MLSVGRELNISDKPFACLVCTWEGDGAKLSTGLAPANDGVLQVYAYRCPRCNSFQVNHKGKLLPFREPSPTHEESQKATSANSDQTMPSQCKGKILR
jgi:hypothetical protein